MYLGSKIFSGAEVLGKNIKLESGNTEILSGRSFILLIDKNLANNY
tara:strand:- start:564 stop:701 length:138 start_codon:yes stop_codon:yes gene_type:complete